MRERQSLYCDSGALDFLSQNVPSGGVPDEVQRSRDSLWWSFFDMASRSILHMDCSLQILYQKTQDSGFYKNLYKKHANGECRLVFDNTAFPRKGEDLDTDDALQLSSVYFITNDSESRSFTGKGVFSISPKTFFKQCRQLFDCDDRTPSFVKGDPANWNFLKKVETVFNSMVIADLYIHDNMDINLLRILDILLPSTLDIDFHLTVFTYDQDRSVGEIYSRISSFLKERRPNLPVRLCVIKAQKSDFHSRNILTNQMRFTSDGGFDILTKKHGASHDYVASKTADISIWHPFMSNKKIKAYNDALEDVRKLFDARGIHEGEFVNRLFSL